MLSKVGKLIVINKNIRKNNRRFCLCLCDCGRIKEIRFDSLKLGNTKSCGCIVKEQNKNRANKHGHTGKNWKSKTYKSWQGMKERCFNSNNIKYKHYGGRGITVCERWRSSFENFLEDMGERPEGMTLDRINNDGNYTPENCRWATYKQQNNNRSIKC